MVHSTFKKTIARTVVLASIFITAFAFTSKAGGDVFEIYLNNKLLVRQYMYKPLDLKTLALTEANSNDQLVVYYNHCGTVGKGRSIAVKDDKGNILKQWKFADTEEKKGPMTIAVKELLALEKKSGQLNMYYTSQELPKGQLLTSFNQAGKSTTSAENSGNADWVIAAAGIASLLLVSFVKVRA